MFAGMTICFHGLHSTDCVQIKTQFATCLVCEMSLVLPINLLMDLQRDSGEHLSVLSESANRKI